MMSTTYADPSGMKTEAEERAEETWLRENLAAARKLESVARRMQSLMQQVYDRGADPAPLDGLCDEAGDCLLILEHASKGPRVLVTEPDGPEPEDMYR